MNTTKLPDIAVSPRAFTKKEILNTIHRIHAGECQKEACGVSGAKRLGNFVYFLLRWEDKSSKPWAEALVEVDMSADKLEPHLLGRFEGLSTASRPVDDKLQIIHTRLGIISKTSDSWGLSTYDPETKQFSRQAMGGVAAILRLPQPCPRSVRRNIGVRNHYSGPSGPGTGNPEDPLRRQGARPLLG